MAKTAWGMFGLTVALWIFGSTCGGAANAGQTKPRAEEEFPIMSWELPKRTAEFGDRDHGLSSLAGAGFTVAGFVRPEHLRQCERLGLKAILCPAEGIPKWEKMSDAEIDQRVRALVAEARGSKAVIGYFLTDEPGVEHFAALAKAVAAVKKYAPGKLAYINLFPDYATLGAPNLSQLGTASYSEYLERFVREVKPPFVSYDNYQIQYSQDQRDAGTAASYYHNLIEVRRVAFANGLPFWNIVSCNEIRPGMPPPSPANLLLQAYTTLAAGARGLTWYTYYSGGYEYAPVNQEGNRTVSWSYLKMVNDQVKVVGRQMLKLHSTGVYFSSPAPASGLPTLPGKVVQSVASGTPVMVGEFAGGEDVAWVMAVNLSLRDSTWLRINWAGAGNARSMSPVDGSLKPLIGNEIWLPAGQGVLIRALTGSVF